MTEPVSIPVYPELGCIHVTPSGRFCDRYRYDHLHLPGSACENGQPANHHRYVRPKRHRHAVPKRPDCWTDWPA